VFQNILSPTRRLTQLVATLLSCGFAAYVAADSAPAATEAPPAGFTIEAGSVAESAGSAEVVVTLSEAVASETGVSIASLPGTAINGRDYYGFYYKLKFAPGETSKTVTITILDDTF